MIQGVVNASHEAVGEDAGVEGILNSPSQP